MSYIQSIILGITQALTEFLPVSSSAHLKIAKHFLGMEQEGVLLDLSCHLGTLVALLLFLRKDIYALLQKPKSLYLLFIALIPLPPLYLLLKPLREWASNTHLLGLCLIGTALILFTGQFFSLINTKKEKAPPKKKREALMIGAMQSVALIPGISRSASTISCARVLGWDIKDAVRFSFLLSIPTVLGGNLLELMKAVTNVDIKANLPIPPLLVAFTTSFFLGTLLVKRAIGWLEKGNLKPCAWYCLALGIMTTLYFNL